MSQPSSSEKSIFLAALEKDSAEELAAYLDQACAGNVPLRAEVEALLAAHGRLGSIRPAPAGDASASADQPGAMIGPYKLLQQIGEGGMGTVYMAEQTHPVQRKVAIKIIRPGMDSKQVIARFEAERQALALMDHPNIAKVLDAGETPPTNVGGSPSVGGSRRPYFVMELVKGVPITKYCDERHLSVQERLELFLPVCQAVQHAHLKGVIHRDLKPTNVLVCLYDGRPVPKIIDFGVAKATASRLTEKTLFTEFGAVVGTLEYMSPEQAELSQLDIDTRSDIYSLGVLLYELLTGTTPLEHKRLKQAAFLEVLRLIREEEAPKPSTRLSTIEELPNIAANRGLEPNQLSGLVRGELDWIVMKCLEKDRARRYETANGLAQDIENYLQDAPVQACPPSAGYRLRKFVRRNKGPAVSVLFVVIALIGGIIGITYGLIRANAARQEEARQRQIAQQERDEKEAARAAEAEQRRNVERERDEKEKARQAEEAQRKIAQDNEKRANDEKARAEAEQESAHAVRKFLQDDLLRMADVREQADAAVRSGGAFRAVENPTIKELLNRAAAGLTPTNIERRFPTKPLVQAEILFTVGRTYLGTGDYARAIDHLERARALYAAHLGRDKPKTLTAMNDLAIAYDVVGRLPEAIRLYEEARDLQIATKGADHSDTLLTLNNLARAYRASGRLRQAIELLEQVRDKQIATLGADNAHTLLTLNSLAAAYLEAGKVVKAVEIFEHLRDVRIDKSGPEHPDTLTALANLALAYQECGRVPEALALLEQVREKRIRMLGMDHPSTLTTLNNLALCLRADGKLPEAIALLEDVREKYTAKYGLKHPQSLMAVKNLALLYQDAKRLPEALQLLEGVREQWNEVFGPDHPNTLIAMGNLARGYWMAKQFDKSIPLYEEVLQREIALTGGTEHPETLLTAFNLGVNYRDANRLEDAVRIFDEWLPRAAERLAPEHTARAFGRTQAISTYTRAGRYDRAEAPLREHAELVKRQAGADSSRYEGALSGLVTNLLRQKKWSDAEPLLRDCLAMREAAEPDGWKTFNLKSILGGALSMQKKFAAAEPLLLEGYEGMKQREKSIPTANTARLTDAATRLVQLYDAWGKPDQAAQWRAKLPAKQTGDKK